MAEGMGIGGKLSMLKQWGVMLYPFPILAYFERLAG
jgi:hypothetical protein